MTIYKHIVIRVTGKVQGVFFRRHACDIALSLDLVGYVRNEQDGSVLIEAEGDTQSLEKLTMWCEEGSKNAEVDTVSCTYTEVIEGYHDFIIR